MRAIVAGYQAGVLRCRLAQQYGISVSSVGRLLRRWREEEGDGTALPEVMAAQAGVLPGRHWARSSPSPGVRRTGGRRLCSMQSGGLLCVIR